MKFNKNFLFIFFVLVIVIGGLVTIGIYEKKSDKKLQASLPTQEEIDKIKTDATTGFNLENQPVLGKEDAPVTVVEFGDFKCPICASWEKTVFPELNKNYIETGKVKFYFINFQFIGKDSLLAGIAGESIYKQNPEQFWKFYQGIYANQGLETNVWATEDFLLSFSKKYIKGINNETLKNDLKKHTYLKEVKQDYEIGKYYGVKGTPSVFINGRMLADPTSFVSLQVAIESALTNGGNSNE